MSGGGPRKLGLREDWASVPFLALTSAGFVVSAYDFWILQGLSFRLSAPLVIGILLVAFGGYLRITSSDNLPFVWIVKTLTDKDSRRSC